MTDIWPENVSEIRSVLGSTVSLTTAVTCSAGWLSPGMNTFSPPDSWM